MKKYLMCLVWICVVGVIWANPSTLIDNFNDTTLTEYIKSVVLEQDGVNALTFASPSGAIQMSKSAGENAEQVLLLRDDYRLGIGQILRIDTTTAVVSYNCDFGIAVSKEVDPVDVVWSSGTADGRHDFLDMYIKAGSTGWGCLGFNGTTQVPNSGYVTAQGNFASVTGLFIKRVSDTVFDVGYSTASGDTVFRTLTVASLSGSYNAVGIYGDLRSVVTYGSMDNLRIESLPYDPSVPPVQVPNGSVIDITFSWKAAPDPSAVISGYAVHPDIVNQYLFVGSGTDPNLYYKGATGVDPGTTNPASQYTMTGAYDTAYRWAVVEAMAGYEQTFTANVSKISTVDPNNIIGPTWSFDSLKSAPVITTNITPAENRVNPNDNASFTVWFTSVSPPTAKWYKYVNGVSDTLLSTGGDITITTAPDPNGYYTTLAIATVIDADQGSYYCKITPEPAVQSGNGLLVIKKLLAQYLFEGNLTDSSGNGAPAGQGKSISGLAEPNALLASNVTLSFVTGVGGAGTQAVKIDPNQYVDFGTAAYPKASSLLNGVGSGLDEGSILCWVKPTISSTVLADYNNGATTGFAFSLAANSGTADGRIDIRGEGPAGEYQVIGTAQGRPDRPGWNIFDGAWHLMVTTWNTGGTLRIYVDGQQVSSVTAGTPARYLVWQRGVLLGAGRNANSRDLLTTLFGGAIDNLRIYNYEIDAETIANEYYTATGIRPCINMTFTGSTYNYDNAGSSYCKIDLADFVVFADQWLNCGLYPGCL